MLYKILFLILICSQANCESKNANESAQKSANKNIAKSLEMPALEVVVGNPNAEFKIIKYVSPTCTHCAEYEKLIYPSFEDYITQNRVCFIVRTLPFFPLDYIVTRLIWCNGYDKVIKNLNIFLANQEQWLKPLLLSKKVQKKMFDEMFDQVLEQTQVTPTQLNNFVHFDLKDESIFLKLFALLAGFSIENIVKALEENSDIDDGGAYNHILALEEFGKKLDFVPAFVINGKAIKGWARPYTIDSFL